jgi:formylmethanofuran dehydrogenase subunit E
VHKDDLDIPRVKCSRCKEMHLKNLMYEDSGRLLCRSCHNRTLWYW